jgi:hypothetical protein
MTQRRTHHQHAPRARVRRQRRDGGAARLQQRQQRQRQRRGRAARRATRVAVAAAAERRPQAHAAVRCAGQQRLRRVGRGRVRAAGGDSGGANISERKRSDR